MNYRNYEFVLAGDKNNDQATLEVNFYKTSALSLQEAISEAYVKLQSLRTENGKTWRIVKATDTTHFSDMKIF